MSEIEKIKERYERRKENFKKENFYFSYYSCFERELKYSEIIKKHFGSDFTDLKIMEIGAGDGDNLLYFNRFGLKWENIYANELLDDRVNLLKENLPISKIIPGNAMELDFKNNFDIVFQSTVFTSILDDNFLRQLSLKMMQMVKKDGIILWYDFKYNNPKNPDVKGVNKNKIKNLFKEATDIKFYNVTLAPPIGRKIGKFYNLVNSIFPFLKTHLIAVIQFQ